MGSETNQKKTWITGFFAMLVVSLFYVLLPNHRYFVDGLSDAYRMERSAELYVHPNHIIWPLVPKIVYEFFGGAAAGISALFFLMKWAIIFGIVSLVGMWILLARCRFSSNGIILGILFFGFSGGVWYFNATANQYSTALALHIFALISYIAIIENAGKPGEVRLKVVSGIITAFAILAHHVNIFLLVPMLFPLWSVPGNRSRNFKPLSISLPIFAAVMILAVIAGAVIAGNTNVQEFLQWQKSYVTRQGYWVSGIGDFFSRNQRGLFEVHLSHINHSEGLFGDPSRFGDSYLIRSGQLYVILFLAGIFLSFISSVFKRRSLTDFQIFGLAVFVPFFLFASVFTPESVNYRIFYMPGFVLLTIPVIEGWNQSAKPVSWKIYAASLAILLMFVTNLYTVFLSQSRPEMNPYYNESMRLASVISEGDLLVLPGSESGYRLSVYIPYFTRAGTIRVDELLGRIRNVPEAVIEQFMQTVDDGGKILVHEDALASGEELERMNAYYGLDCRPGEILDFLQTFASPSGYTVIYDKKYYFIVPDE